MFDIPYYITTTEELRSFCRRIRQDLLDEKAQSFVTVDTEFLRRSTYWAKLALVQIASPKSVGLIDMLSPGLLLDDLKALLTDPSILKVFHAARQDFEVLWHTLNILPFPFYDTQIAAMACGFGDCIGYEALVGHFMKIKLDKTQQFTNWLQRPLRPEQIEYATKDVIYLRQIYQQLNQELELKQRTSWINEEMAQLANPEIYKACPQEAWKRLKLRSVNKKVDLSKLTAALQHLAAWREEQAQQQDIPRLHILKDENIIDTALALATASLSDKKADLLLFRKITTGASKDNPSYWRLKENLRHINQGLLKPAITLTLKKPLDSSLYPLFDFLCFFLKYRAEQLGIVSKLLTTATEIEQFVIDNDFAANFLQGWRWQCFGQEAKELKEGKKALYFDQQLKTTSF